MAYCALFITIHDQPLNLLARELFKADVGAVLMLYCLQLVLFGSNSVFIVSSSAM